MSFYSSRPKSHRICAAVLTFIVSFWSAWVPPHWVHHIGESFHNHDTFELPLPVTKGHGSQEAHTLSHDELLSHHHHHSNGNTATEKQDSHQRFVDEQECLALNLWKGNRHWDQGKSYISPHFLGGSFSLFPLMIDSYKIRFLRYFVTPRGPPH